ncbi:hypothetical protein T4D_13612 [Trichinella pseudospiralis]|uniref:Uncharacterized protein n=1 Tax=Trichinella pseudospiralis TaxID=6337 RepID=A0A0V1FIN4_TRIPS|nr:hypothetical protein T4D_13612 [Trichinella pseudospiralis]
MSSVVCGLQTHLSNKLSFRITRNGFNGKHSCIRSINSDREAVIEKSRVFAALHNFIRPIAVRCDYKLSFIHSAIFQVHFDYLFKDYVVKIFAQSES